MPRKWCRVHPFWTSTNIMDLGMMVSQAYLWERGRVVEWKPNKTGKILVFWNTWRSFMGCNPFPFLGSQQPKLFFVLTKFFRHKVLVRSISKEIMKNDANPQPKGKKALLRGVSTIANPLLGLWWQGTPRYPIIKLNQPGYWQALIPVILYQMKAQMLGLFFVVASRLTTIFPLFQKMQHCCPLRINKGS